MARPGRWIYDDNEFLITSTAVQADDILGGASHPAGSTVRRVIGHVDAWLQAPPGSVQNYLLRVAVHQLGAAADIDEGTANAFPSRFPYRTTLGLYATQWDPQRQAFWYTNSVSFDVDGDRILTASNPTLRLAVQPTGVPRSDGFIFVTASTRTFVSDPP